MCLGGVYLKKKQRNIRANKMKSNIIAQQYYNTKLNYVQKIFTNSRRFLTYKIAIAQCISNEGVNDIYRDTLSKMFYIAIIRSVLL